MSEQPRQRLRIKTIPDVSELGQMTKTELLDESTAFDKENYYPLANLNEKQILTSKNRSDIVTLRLTPHENNLISDLADEIGLSKSAFIRMVVKKALKEYEYHTN